MTKLIRTQQQSDSRPKLSIEDKALQVLKDPDFFGQVRQAVERDGLVGEVQNALAIYVMALSSLRDLPLNVLVKGPSAGGKNFLASRVLRLFPTTAIREITSASETAWNYAGDYFRNKVVYLHERNKGSGAVHPIRLLISERKITRIVTAREGGTWVKKEFVAEGPIAAISTSTRDRIEVDDETRHVSLWIDESKEQNRRISKRKLSPLEPLGTEQIQIWHAVYNLVSKRASAPIVFPEWFNKIADKTYDGDISVRRYFPAFLEVVRMVGLLRSFQKQPEDFEMEESIDLTFIDYAIAAYIFDDIFVASFNRDEECIKTAKTVESIASTQNDEPVDANQLAKYLEISYDKASAKLRSAVEAGTIEQANTPERNNSKRYRPAKTSRFIPDPKEVASELINLKKPIEIVHPVTGQTFRFGRK
jgi:hypothetical protein